MRGRGRWPVERETLSRSAEVRRHAPGYRLHLPKACVLLPIPRPQGGPGPPRCRRADQSHLRLVARADRPFHYPLLRTCPQQHTAICERGRCKECGAAPSAPRSNQQNTRGGGGLPCGELRAGPRICVSAARSNEPPVPRVLPNQGPAAVLTGFWRYVVLEPLHRSRPGLTMSLSPGSDEGGRLLAVSHNLCTRGAHTV